MAEIDFNITEEGIKEIMSGGRVGLKIDNDIIWLQRESLQKVIRPSLGLDIAANKEQGSVKFDPLADRFNK